MHPHINYSPLSDHFNTTTIFKLTTRVFIVGPSAAATSHTLVVTVSSLVVAAAVGCNVSEVHHQPSVRLPAESHCFLMMRT